MGGHLIGEGGCANGAVNTHADRCANRVGV